MNGRANRTSFMSMDMRIKSTCQTIRKAVAGDVKFYNRYFRKVHNANSNGKKRIVLQHSLIT